MERASAETCHRLITASFMAASFHVAIAPQHSGIITITASIINYCRFSYCCVFNMACWLGVVGCNRSWHNMLLFHIVSDCWCDVQVWSA